MKIMKKRSSLFKNILTLSSGTAIAQVLPILLSPFLSRIYTPEDFAVFALVTAVISIVATFSTFRLELATVIPDNEDEARALFSTALVSNLLVVVISLLVIGSLLILSAGYNLINGVNNNLFLYIPAGIWVLGWYQTSNYWSTRHKTYLNNAISKIVQAVTTVLFSIGMGLIIPGAEGLIIGFVCGYFLGLVVLLIRQRKGIRLNELHHYSFKASKAILHKFRNFIFVNTPHSLMGVFADQGIVYVIESFFDKMIVGSFSFAFRYTKAPLGIITTSISQVFFEEASSAANAGKDVRPIMFKIQRSLFLLGIVPFVVLMFYMPDLFAFVFSDKYYHAGEISRILLPWLFLNLLMSPVSTITLVFNKQKQALLIAISDLTIRISAIVVGGILGSSNLAFMLMSIFGSLLLIFALWWFYHIAKPSNSKRY